MIRMICDVCGKTLRNDCHDVVNLDFHSYGASGFVLEIDKYKPLQQELNLCVECAEHVVSDIEDLRRIFMKEGEA